LVVNIPEYKLHVYENGNHVFDMNVVVGSEKNQTAIFNDELTHIVFSPYWNVPQSIVQNEILPAMRRNRRYLSANGYERVGTENGLPKIRQKPGKGNSLGLVKFLFPNEHDIYFHDSPAKSLFTHRIRAYSHGCVRLAEPAKLAAYLLKDDPQWSPDKIEAAMNAGKEEWVKLSATVPVSIIYLTAWVDHEGVLNFRDDVYEKDNTNAVASRGQ
jgi:L,D-transpeptidase YcbB